MKTRVLAIAIIVLLASPGGSGSNPVPATDEQQQESQEQQGPQQEQGQEQPQGEKQKAEDELREFVPSEEVSPDLSISFPVDI